MNFISSQADLTSNNLWPITNFEVFYSSYLLVLNANELRKPKSDLVSILNTSIGTSSIIKV